MEGHSALLWVPLRAVPSESTAAASASSQYPLSPQSSGQLLSGHAGCSHSSPWFVSCLASVSVALATVGAASRRNNLGASGRRCRQARAALARRAKKDEQFDDLLAELDASSPSGEKRKKGGGDGQFDDLLQELESADSASKGSAPRSAPKVSKKDAQLSGIIGELEAESRQGRRKGELKSIISELEYESEALGDTSLPKEEGFLVTVKESLGWIFVSDFLLVIFLSIWFVIGVIGKYLVGSDGILDVFLQYWDPYFQAVLGVLFAFRLATFVLSSVWGLIRGEGD